MSIYGNPVMLGGSGGGSGGSGWYYGTSTPSSSLGSTGDLYVQYKQKTAFDGNIYNFSLIITRALRGNSVLTYAGALEIKLIFDDGNGNEVNIRDIPSFSVSATSTNGDPGTPSWAFDNSFYSYWEAYNTPITLKMSAAVPAGYEIKRLEVYQRTGQYDTDVWSTFSLVSTLYPEVVFLEYKNLTLQDWAGAGNWTVFPRNIAPDPGGYIIVEVFVKGSDSTWTPFVDWLP